MSPTSRTLAIAQPPVDRAQKGKEKAALGPSPLGLQSSKPATSLIKASVVCMMHYCKK
jgi:hypothetical protein